MPISETYRVAAFSAVLAIRAQVGAGAIAGILSTIGALAST
jgi:hypothetical protein